MCVKYNGTVGIVVHKYHGLLFVVNFERVLICLH